MANCVVLDRLPPGSPHPAVNAVGDVRLTIIPGSVVEGFGHTAFLKVTGPGGAVVEAEVSLRDLYRQAGNAGDVARGAMDLEMFD